MRRVKPSEHENVHTRKLQTPKPHIKVQEHSQAGQRVMGKIHIQGPLVLDTASCPLVLHALVSVFPQSPVASPLVACILFSSLVAEPLKHHKTPKPVVVSAPQRPRLLSHYRRAAYISYWCSIEHVGRVHNTFSIVYHYSIFHGCQCNDSAGEASAGH
jgi:hypothetical protein